MKLTLSRAQELLAVTTSDPHPGSSRVNL